METGETSPGPLPPAPIAGLKAGSLLGGGRYEILRLLGAGGMGAVYESRHVAIGKHVAIKVLRSEVAGDGQAVARFLREAQAANQVHHRHIVEVTDFGVDDGRPYMVMEFLRGESLSALMERERVLAPGKIIRLMDPVLRALQFAHERGIVHRDVKPENIFLAREEGVDEPVPKILDFGIAKSSRPEDVRLTATHMSLGTPAYMAPEQVMGARDVTALADQYSVGALLYEALAGRMPHNGDTYNALIIAKVTEPPMPLSDLRPDLDKALVAVIMRALASRPEDRFANCTALREALQPWRDLIGTLGSPVVPTRGAGDVTLPDGTAVLPSPIDAAARPVGTAETLAATAPPATGQGALWPTSADALLSKAARAEVAVTLPAPVEAPVVPSSSSSSRTGTWIGLVAAMAVVAAGGIAWTVRRSAGETATPVAVAAVNPPAASIAAPPAAAPAPVTFRIHASPAETEIVLDGQSVGRGEAEVLRPRDGARHALELRAAGHHAVTEVLTADGDARIDRVLERTEPTPQPAPNPASPVPPRGEIRRPIRERIEQRQPPPPPPQPAEPPRGDRRRERIDRVNPF